MALTEEEKRAYQKAYRRKNKEKIASSKKRCYEAKRSHYIKKKRAYYQENKAKYYKSHTEYRKKNWPKILALCRKNKRKYSDELTDSHVKAVLSKHDSFRSGDVPQDLIKLKRQQIILDRTIKEIQKCRQ